MKGGYQRAPDWGISETLLARSPALSWREIAGLTAVGQGLIAWIQPICSCCILSFPPPVINIPIQYSKIQAQKAVQIKQPTTPRALFSSSWSPRLPLVPFEMLTPASASAPLPHSQLPLFTVSDLSSSFKPHLKYPSSWKLRSHVLC